MRLDSPGRRPRCGWQQAAHVPWAQAVAVWGMWPEGCKSGMNCWNLLLLSHPCSGQPRGYVGGVPAWPQPGCCPWGSGSGRMAGVRAPLWMGRWVPHWCTGSARTVCSRQVPPMRTSPGGAKSQVSCQEGWFPLRAGRGGVPSLPSTGYMSLVYRWRAPSAVPPCFPLCALGTPQSCGIRAALTTSPLPDCLCKALVSRR